MPRLHTHISGTSYLREEGDRYDSPSGGYAYYGGNDVGWLWSNDTLHPADQALFDQYDAAWNVVELPAGRKTSRVTLDPEDPFDAVLIGIVETNRRKRSDYATDGDIFVNFRRSAAFVGVKGFGPREAVLHNIGQKLARLEALRENGRMNEPSNESVADTYLDLAVYLIILKAIENEESA